MTYRKEEHIAGGSSLPCLFVSHGAPTFALEPGVIGEKLNALGRQLPPVKAIVIVSPHWISEGVIGVTAGSRPETMHDFGGFDPALNELQYPAPGDPVLAERILEQLNGAGWTAQAERQRGLDHGAWVPLLHMFPDAAVPVVQVSLPGDLDGERAWQLGRSLAPLSELGVLVIGSGSLTHNLYEVFRGAEDVGYAQEFVEWIRRVVRSGQLERLMAGLEEAPHAQRAHPTPEHFWPLVVAAAAAGSGATSVLEGGMRYRVLPMDAFVFGSL
ncbi:DODA-type extradiol aromatic ring-opening family dioxygenase [Wenzhouxiangella sp. EGI_FJ10409]|uniref:DODA-type extradiol aromatic ring-opening family dioxygenase n=1 Tax=Wenzhouxiangella sp. EGI_FJ10409 TaxID=3243767 RepID=UPI0035D7B1D0